MKKRKKHKKRPWRNWLVEDNLVALYIAMYEYKDLDYELEEIKKIIPHSGFDMRPRQIRAVFTDGENGPVLLSGRNVPLYGELYEMFKDFGQKKFAKLVNFILEVKSNITDC